MRKTLASLFPLAPYADQPFQQWRAAALYVCLLFFAAARLLFLLPGVLNREADQLGWDHTLLIAANAVALGVAVAAWLLARRGDLKYAIILTIALLLLESALFYLAGESWDASPRGWAELWAAVVLGGLLLAEREGIGVTLAALAVVAMGVLRGLSGDPNAAERRQLVDAFGTLSLWTLALAGMTVLVARGARRAAQKPPTPDVPHHLIEIGGEVAHGLFSRMELDTLLDQIANSIQRRFPLVYYVQIFLIEPGSPHATLRAGTGIVGTQLVSQEYQLDVGGLSVIGRVTLRGDPLLIPDLSRDPIHKPHPLLPETRSELAIPLVVNGETIGALDLHSQMPNAFDPGDATVLRATATQIAVAVDGLRLYESVQRSLRENQALNLQTQASLREIERLNYQLTGRAWTDYLHLQTDSTSMALDFDSGQIFPEADWTPTLEEAAAQQRLVSQTAEGRRVVALPILVRNEVIGAMEFELSSEEELPDGALDMVAAVGQRLGLAMENRRLFDETQKVAQREALINDIGAGLQASTAVDVILQQAARHLQSALAAHQVTIRLGTTPDQRGQTVQEKART